MLAVCTDNTCEYECDIAAGGCICLFGYTVDGDSCLGLPDEVDAEMKASINGDPHVILVDDAGVAFCFDVTTATETTAVLIQDQDIGKSSGINVGIVVSSFTRRKSGFCVHPT